MTALLIIMFVLLIALVIWAVGITMLYGQLFRTIKKITATDSESMHALFECNTWMTQLIRESLDTTEAMHRLVTEYRATIDEELERNAENKKFALNTIQEARRLYNAINASIAPEVEDESDENEA